MSLLCCTSVWAAQQKDRTRHLSAIASAYENGASLCCTKILCQVSSVKRERKERLFHTYPGHSLRFQVFSAHLCKFWRGRTETAHHNHFFYCHKYHSICRGDCSTLSSKGYQCQTVKKIPAQSIVFQLRKIQPMNRL